MGGCGMRWVEGKNICRFWSWGEEQLVVLRVRSVNRNRWEVQVVFCGSTYDGLVTYPHGSIEQVIRQGPGAQEKD